MLKCYLYSYWRSKYLQSIYMLNDLTHDFLERELPISTTTKPLLDWGCVNPTTTRPEHLVMEIQDLDLDALAMEKGSPLAAA